MDRGHGAVVVFLLTGCLLGLWRWCGVSAQKRWDG
jgi:hypothetical protein